MPTAVELPGRTVLPFEMMSTLQRIANLCGSGLRVTEADGEWVRFHVANIPDASLLRRLDGQSALVFGNNQGRFQLLCPEVSDGKRGIFLHYLSTPELQEEYLPGVWFY